MTRTTARRCRRIAEHRIQEGCEQLVRCRQKRPLRAHGAGNQIAKFSTKELNKSSKKTDLPKTVEETKTDFIALSYAANTDSGQIVRVKVPSSMMVSLGVATNVEKGSDLVNAEVVIGDDGLARAIRFIR